MPDYDLQKLDDYRWQIPQTDGMRVPARLYATEEMLEDILEDDAPQQAANVAHMPGIVGASMAMPDIHWGYGFPIGGVAAFGGGAAEVTQDEHADVRGQRGRATLAVHEGDKVVDRLMLALGDLLQRFPHLRFQPEARPPAVHDDVAADERGTLAFA